LPADIPRRGRRDVRVTIDAYNSDWPAQYARERERVASALRERALRIEHIGSTAVPGLAAKPVIDILAAVDDIRDTQIHLALRSAGYALVVEEPDHRMYRTARMDVHVHLWPVGSPEIERHLKFRDWLRAHPSDRDLYEHVKRKFAEREWNDRNDYAEAKTPVVNAILRRANGQRYGPRVDEFANLIAQYVPAPARLLEVGAGEGELARTLDGAGYDVVALDRHLRSTFPVVESAFEDFDAEPQSFDGILAQLVLHHVENLDAFLEKCSASLRPRGILAIDDYGWERSKDPAFRADRADLQTSQTMLSALRSHFREVAYSNHAYFDEGAGSDLLGFTFIGRRLD
jgi:GrpB-like predicted nucleotidyltransferase (UPF0157 family)